MIVIATFEVLEKRILGLLCGIKFNREIDRLLIDNSTDLNIPDSYTWVCITPLGIPTEWFDSPPKKKLEGFIACEKL